jgi:iron complex outermembrane receptor protein
MKHLLQSAASPAVLLAVLAVGAGAPALAQAAEIVTADLVANTEGGGAGLEEVVVTAQKRATNLQDTPIAMSVLGASALEDRHVQSLADLGDGAIPSLRVAPFFARQSALTIGLRGIGAAGDANQPARDQAVGVYVNGVYLGRAQGLGAALYDVERIEVLKGPQGTLFGRNTEGGAVSIVTRAPTGQFHLNVAGGLQNYDGYRGELHLDLPEFAKVSVKLDAMVTQRDGTVVNPVDDGQPDFNSYNRRGFSVEALWRPVPNFSADYAYDNSYDATTPYYVQLLNKGTLPLAPINPLQPTRAKRANIGVPQQPSVGKTSGHRLNLDWHPAEWLQVKSITAYRELDQSQYDNGVALSAYVPNAPFSRYSLAFVRQNQFSEELQFIGRLPEVEFVGGAFYYREGVNDSAQTPNTLQWNATGTGYSFLSVDLATYPRDRFSHVKTKSYGMFGQAVWTPAALGDRAHLTVGGRFTHDEKTGALTVVNGALPSYVSNGRTVTGEVPLDASWERFDPMVDLALDVTEDINLYGKWSTGYKAGGANSRSLTYRPFDPESVSMFEIGAKSEFWDRRARLNLAAYTGDLKDVQVDFSVIIVGNNRGTLETTNAATGRTKGFEADFSIAPLPGLTLGLNYAYTKVTLSNAFNPFTNAQSQVYPLYTPRNAVSASVDYQRPFVGATFRAHLDANYGDKQFTSTTDRTPSQPYTLVNARVAIADIPLQAQDARLEVAAWSRNLFNEQHAFLRNYSSALGVFGIFNEPRTYGVEARVRF